MSALNTRVCRVVDRIVKRIWIVEEALVAGEMPAVRPACKQMRSC